ncbi:Non-motile and phage-resistance protein [subsurface metagenome]
MAHRVYSISRNERDSQRFTSNLQHHSRLLLEANKELKKATRAKSEFVSKMSHEFRAALNVIIGFTELMLDEVPGPINQRQRHSLNDIHASSQRLLELVNEYLEHPGLEDENVIQTTCENR